MPEQRDIVLVTIPFTNLSSTKRRPVVIVSNDDYNGQSADIVVAAMTSNIMLGDYGVTITTSDLESGSLKRHSQIRCDRLYTLAQGIVVKRLGRVNEATFDRMCRLFQNLIARR